MILVVDLDQLLLKYNVTKNDLQRLCNQKLLVHLHKHIEYYEEVGRYLELTEQEIMDIRKEETCESSRRMATLNKWQSKNEHDATYLVLVERFIEMEDRVLAEAVIRYHKAHVHEDLAQLNAYTEKVHPNWKTLSKEKREEIIRELELAYRNIRIAYSDVVLDVEVLFEKCNVDPRDVKLKLKSYIKGQLTVNNSDDSRALSEVPNDMHDIFSYIDDHTSWINYDLLEIVIKKFGNDEAKNLLGNYKKDHLIPYIKRPLFEVPTHSFITKPISQSIEASLMIYDDVELTIREALMIEQKLAKFLEISTQLIGYDGGSVKLLFRMPKWVYDSASPDTPLRQYVKLDEASQSYVIDADVITIL